VIVLAATRLEERAARRELAHLGVAVVRSGVGRGGTFEDTVVSCGLAGGLRRGVPSGAVLIPSEVARPTGERIVCDREIAARLRDAARALGETPLDAPLLGASALVRGDARRAWAERGFAGADMESGAIVAPRLAVVRVVLDTPERELSDAWLQPRSVFLRPQAWRELPWLARHAVRYARLAAKIVRNALPSGEMP
jgi:hypothetical protein